MINKIKVIYLSLFDQQKELSIVPFVIIIYQMFEKERIKSRQNDQKKAKIRTKRLIRTQMPFHLQRHQYKELICYEKKGHWSQKQKLKYAVFLEYFKKRFEIKAKRRFNNIFDLMATFIKTRNPHQCRSHHQKMQKQKFKIDSIIINTSSKYHPRVYKQLRDRYITQIQSLNFNEYENFEKFKERIQRIEQRKAIQRQVIANNRRVLRSTNISSSNNSRKMKKLMRNEKKKEQARLRIKDDQARIEETRKEINIKKQEQDQKIKQHWIQKPQIDQIPTQTPSVKSNTFKQQIQQPVRGAMNVNHWNYVQKIQDLEIRKKGHLDSAYMHYNMYMKHANEANSIQFQIMKQNSLRGGLHHF